MASRPARGRYWPPRTSPRAFARAGLIAAGLAALPLATPAGAAPVSATLRYSCNFPLLPEQPLTLTVHSDIPTSVPVQAPTVPSFHVEAAADVPAAAAKGLRVLGAATIEGTALATAPLTLPGGGTRELHVQANVSSTPIPADGGFTVAATGQVAAPVFDEPGEAKVQIGDLVLTLVPRLADGGETGLESFETECSLAPGQDTTFATIQVVDDGPTAVAYGVSGSAQLHTLTTGTVPLHGSATGRFDSSSGAFSVNESLDPTQARLVSLGFLPVTAKIVIEQLTPLAGTVTPAGLTAKTTVRIKLPELRVLGLLLAGGSGCQTRAPAALALSSASGGFDPLHGGGRLAGTFAISDLTGCGALTGLVSPLTRGGGNAIAINLTSAAA